MTTMLETGTTRTSATHALRLLLDDVLLIVGADDAAERYSSRTPAGRTLLALATLARRAAGALGADPGVALTGGPGIVVQRELSPPPGCSARRPRPHTASRGRSTTCSSRRSGCGRGWRRRSRRPDGPEVGDPARTRGVISLAEVSSPDRSATVRDALGLGLAVGLYGAAFGAAADAAGLNVWQAMSLSALMFTGASQFAMVGVLGAGGSALAAVGSALLLGTRNTVYGVRLVPLLQPRGLVRRVGTAHWVIDETTAMSLAAPNPVLGKLAFLVTGASIYLMWNAMTVVGALGAAGLGGTARAALDAVVPAAFLALLWPRLRKTFPEAAAQRKVALGGAVVALALTPFVPPGVQVIAAVVAVALAGRPRAGERPTASEEMA
jgi:predicted branched-subunit amino acid permease